MLIALLVVSILLNVSMCAVLAIILVKVDSFHQVDRYTIHDVVEDAELRRN